MKLNITGIRGIPAKHGGFETFAEALSIYLRDQNWKVTIYCQSDGWGFVSEDNWNGIRRITIPIPLSGPLSTILFDFLSTLHVCLFSRSLTLVLGYNTAIFSIFYRLSGITSVMNMDGIEWQRRKWGAAAKVWLKFNELLGCKLSNHLIADHDGIKSHLISRHGELPISTIPYGARAITESSIDHIKAYQLEPNNYYLVIARPEPENSILEIVSAFVESDSKKKLVLLGDYNLAVKYQSTVINKSDDRVIFPGPIYDQAIVSALRYYCFAYIHGHTVGGTNPSLVEAMGANCPIIAHNNIFNKGVCGDAAFYFQNSSELKILINNATDESLQKLKNASNSRFNNYYLLESVHKKYSDLLSKL